MDPKTLFICSMVVSALLSAALLLYRFKQKTYPGFGLWVASTFLVTAGYYASLIRLAGLDFLSIVLNNWFFSFALMMRLAGVVRFLRDRRMPWPPVLLVPIIEAAAASYFYLAVDWFAVRAFILSLVLGSIALIMGYVYFNSRADGKVTIYRIMGWLSLSFTVVLLVRCVSLFFDRSVGMFTPQIVQNAYLMAVMMIEIASAIGFFMMNSQRIEAELRASQDSLGQTVSKLEKSLAEIKTLSGLLPICANCKKVRNDQGYWQQIEVYISEHSTADFSHGICPDCARKLYPNINLERWK